MRLSVIINTFNEGPRVAATAKSFLDAGVDEVVICDDGSTDGCCNLLPSGCVVVRHNQPAGCGISKFDASNTATGDVLIWVDAHQAVISGDIRKMGMAALSQRAIVCPKLVNIFYDENWQEHIWGRGIPFYPNDAAILPDCTAQYVIAKPSRLRMVGVGLCMSRKTYMACGGWNRFIARLGSQERGMALRAYMAGIEVQSYDAVVIGHEFFGKNHPSRNPASGKYRFNNGASPMANVWHAYMAVCSPSGFENHLKPILLSIKNGQSGAQTLKHSLCIEDRDYYLRNCRRRTDADLFALMEQLLQTREPEQDCGGARLEPAAVRLIGSMARGRCLELGTGDGHGTRALLRGAMSVVSVDHMPSFTKKADETIKDSRVTFVTCPLNPESGFYDLSGIVGKFDFILIDGPPGQIARRNGISALLPFLADGGLMLEDDFHRDMTQISQSCRANGLRLEKLATRRGLAVISRNSKNNTP